MTLDDIIQAGASFPDLWHWCEIKDVARIIMGQAPPGDTYNMGESGTPLVAGASDLGDIYPIPTKWTTSPGQLCETGDIIYCIRATIGEMNWADKVYCLGRGVAAIRPDKALIDPYFLYYALLVGRDRLLRLATGSTFVQVRRQDIEQQQIPLPPLLEQQRIARILRQADDIRRQCHATETRAAQLLPALFNDMFGDPVINPKGWHVLPLKEMGRVTTGNTPPREHPEYYGDYIDWVKSDNLDGPLDYVTPAKEKLSQEGMKRGRIAPKGSTLITCIAGSPDSIGKAALAGENIAFNQQLNAVFPYKHVNSYFLYGAIKLLKPQIQALSSKGMKGIVNKTVLEGLEVICPDKPKQDQFESVALNTISVKTRQQEIIDRIEDLSASLLARAFSGNLTSAWRETHASELQKAANERDIRLGLRIRGNVLDLSTKAARDNLVKIDPSWLKSISGLPKIDLGISSALATLGKVDPNWLKSISSLPHINPAFTSMAAEIAKSITAGLQNPVADAASAMAVFQAQQMQFLEDSVKSFAAGIQEPLSKSVLAAQSALAAQFAPFRENAKSWSSIIDRQFPRLAMLVEMSEEQQALHDDLRKVVGTSYYEVNAVSHTFERQQIQVREDLRLFAALGLVREVAVGTTRRSREQKEGDTPPLDSFDRMYRALRPDDDVRESDLTFLQAGEDAVEDVEEAAL